MTLTSSYVAVLLPERDITAAVSRVPARITSSLFSIRVFRPCTNVLGSIA
jgi:hypothetical protein